MQKYKQKIRMRLNPKQKLKKQWSCARILTQLLFIYRFLFISGRDCEGAVLHWDLRHGSSCRGPWDLRCRPFREHFP